MRIVSDPCLLSDLPEYVVFPGSVDERDLRPGHEVELLLYLHDPYCVRVVPSIKVEKSRDRHNRDPLVQAT